MTTIESFLRFGNFGEIRVGCTVDQVIQVLGKPQDTMFGGRFRQGADAWRYGPLQIGFADFQVSWILISVFSGGAFPKPFEAEPWPFTRTTGKEAFLRYLADQGIDFEDPCTSDLGIDLGVRVGLGVQAFFDDFDEDDQFLKIITSPQDC